jgi:hypothetical protein
MRFGYCATRAAKGQIPGKPAQEPWRQACNYAKLIAEEDAKGYFLRMFGPEVIGRIEP